jgi:hypothetical protein
VNNRRKNKLFSTTTADFRFDEKVPGGLSPRGVFKIRVAAKRTMPYRYISNMKRWNVHEGESDPPPDAPCFLSMG